MVGYCCVVGIFGYAILQAFVILHSIIPAILSGLCFIIWLVRYAIDYGAREKVDWKKYSVWKLVLAVVAFGVITASVSWFVFRALYVNVESTTLQVISVMLHWGIWLATWLFLFVISLDDELKWTRHNLSAVPIAGVAFLSVATIAANVDLTIWWRILFSVVIPLILYVNCYRCLYEMTFSEQLICCWEIIIDGINLLKERRSRVGYHTYHTEEQRGGIDFLGVLDVLTSNDEETTRRYGFNEYDIEKDSLGNRFINTYDGIRYLDDSRPNVYHGYKYEEMYDQFGNRIDD
ncbi:MAG: hypothetical protein ACI4MG_05535 [Aristaeellaceae bacterium]